MIDRLKAMVGGLNRWIDRHVWTRAARRAVSRFLAHDDLQYAGSMAYFSILSVFQLLVLGVIGLSFFLDELEARKLVVGLVTRASPLDASTVSEIIQSINEARTGIGILSLAFLLWGALGLFSAINKGINMAWSGPGGPPPAFLRDKLIGLLLIVLTGALGVLSVGVGIVIGVLERVSAPILTQLPGGGLALALVTLLVPLLLSFVALVVLYRLVPTPPLTFSKVWPGAAVAAVLWEALRHLFTFYTTQIARYDSAFGPISTGITLIVFLYFASVILLLGANIAEAYAVESGKVAAPAAAPVEVGPSVPLDPSRVPATRIDPATSGSESARGGG